MLEDSLHDNHLIASNGTEKSVGLGYMTSSLLNAYSCGSKIAFDDISTINDVFSTLGIDGVALLNSIDLNWMYGSSYSGLPYPQKIRMNPTPYKILKQNIPQKSMPQFHHMYDQLENAYHDFTNFAFANSAFIVFILLSMTDVRTRFSQEHCLPELYIHSLCLQCLDISAIHYPLASFYKYIIYYNKAVNGLLVLHGHTNSSQSYFGVKSDSARVHNKQILDEQFKYCVKQSAIGILNLVRSESKKISKYEKIGCSTSLSFINCIYGSLAIILLERSLATELQPEAGDEHRIELRNPCFFPEKSYQLLKLRGLKDDLTRKYVKHYLGYDKAKNMEDKRLMEEMKKNIFGKASLDFSSHQRAAQSFVKNIQGSVHKAASMASNIVSQRNTMSSSQRYKGSL